MPDHTPAMPAALPLGMRIILAAFYLLLAAGCALLFSLLALFSDNPFSSDLQFIFWGAMVPLAPVLFFSLRAIIAVHTRRPEAPRRCLHVLTVNICLMGLLGIAWLWLVSISGYSWRRDMMEVLSIVFLPVLTNGLFLWMAWRYLRHSPLVHSTFGGEAAANGAGGGVAHASPTNPADALPVPAGIHLFTAACTFALLYKGYLQSRTIWWVTTENLALSISSDFLLYANILLGLLQLVILGYALSLRFKRPAHALGRIQGCLVAFLAFQVYFMLRLFLQNGLDALESTSFLWISSYGLSAGAFLLYFKTSALARGFLSAQPAQGHTP